MELFEYTGTDERTFPSRSLVVRPGDQVEWEEAPGFDWKPVNSEIAPTEAPEGGVESSRMASEVPQVTPADQPTA